MDTWVRLISLFIPSWTLCWLRAHFIEQLAACWVTQLVPHLIAYFVSCFINIADDKKRPNKSQHTTSCYKQYALLHVELYNSTTGHLSYMYIQRLTFSIENSRFESRIKDGASSHHGCRSTHMYRHVREVQVYIMTTCVLRGIWIQWDRCAAHQFVWTLMVICSTYGHVCPMLHNFWWGLAKECSRWT